MGTTRGHYPAKMYRLVAILALVALSSALRVERNELWAAYKQSHNRNYVGQQDVVRREIWEDNLDWIERHNIEADRGMHTYWCGENQFTDMTNDEFRAQMNGYVMHNRTNPVQFVSTGIKIADSVDWRTKGYVTPVKNQEHCGSCWAFSTTGSLEGQHFKAAGKLVSLSEQNLVDCSKNEGNKGCQGGLMDNGFEYIKKNGGIDTEASYPYTAKNGRCHYRASDSGATDPGYVDIRSGSETALQQAVATVGPISVAIDASHTSFQLYR